MIESSRTHRAPSEPRPGLRKRLSAAFATRLSTYRSRSLAWRALAPAVFVLAGALFITSAISSGGTDLRAGRYADLDSLVNHQAKEVELLRAESAELTKEIDALSAGLGNRDVARARKRVDAIRGPAGLVAVRGPGLTIALNDAPEGFVSSTDIAVGNLVVHQQDIQAVANALWAGGAEAMTIQGQRVISTTGIKCVGNTVLLHGVPYSPPYVLSAVGNPDTMLTSVNASPYIGIYLQYVEAGGLGWSLDVESELKLPGYDGSTELSYARPAGNTGGAADNGT